LGTAPVLISEDALMAAGLIQPFIRVEYLYRTARLAGGDEAAAFSDRLIH
jgi:predicted lysophospholipase L1 biosynthesis ABC-type transport system permease subunit